MYFKKKLLAVIVILLISKNAFAMELGHGFDFETELTATSDYRFMGLSQTRGNPALQAGGTLATPIGLYVGAWASTVEFSPDVKTRLERDYYIGWFIPINDNLSIDIGWLKYDYKGSSLLNSSIWYSTIKYSNFKLEYEYSSDINGDQTGDYTTLGYSYPFSDSLRAEIRYGVVDYKDKNIVSDSGDARSKYGEWEVGVEKDLWGATWRASWVDTDLSKSECLNSQGYDDVCSSSLIAKVTKKF